MRVLLLIAVSLGLCFGAPVSSDDAPPFPPASNILNYGFDLFSGNTVVGDDRAAKGQVLRWAPSSNTISLKEGLEVTVPVGWDVLPGLHCVSGASESEITHNDFRSQVNSASISQLNEQSSVITHSDMHSTSHTEKHPGVLDVLSSVGTFIGGVGKLAGALAEHEGSMVASGGLAKGLSPPAPPPSGDLAAGLAANVEATHSRQLLGGSEDTTTNSSTVGWTDLAGSSISSADSTNWALEQSKSGFSYFSKETSYGEYFRMRMKNYEDATLFAEAFSADEFDPMFAQQVKAALDAIKKQPACYKKGGKSNATYWARCWEYTGDIMKDYGQYVIADAAMGFRKSRFIFYHGGTTSAERASCFDKVKQNQTWVTAKTDQHTTSTNGTATDIAACKTGGAGASTFASASYSTSDGTIPGCEIDGKIVPSSEAAIPVPVRSSIILISALPFSKIDGIDSEGGQILHTAMNQWMTNAVLSIRNCNQTDCNGNGKCVAAWSTNSKGQAIIKGSGCFCDPGYEGDSCQANSVHVQLHKTFQVASLPSQVASIVGVLDVDVCIDYGATMPKIPSSADCCNGATSYNGSWTVGGKTVPNSTAEIGCSCTIVSHAGQPCSVSSPQALPLLSQKGVVQVTVDSQTNINGKKTPKKDDASFVTNRTLDATVLADQTEPLSFLFNKRMVAEKADPMPQVDFLAPTMTGVGNCGSYIIFNPVAIGTKPSIIAGDIGYANANVIIAPFAAGWHNDEHGVRSALCAAAGTSIWGSGAGLPLPERVYGNFSGELNYQFETSVQVVESHPSSYAQYQRMIQLASQIQGVPAQGAGVDGKQFSGPSSPISTCAASNSPSINVGKVTHC